MKTDTNTLRTIIASLLLLGFCYPAEPETENAADPGTLEGAIAHFALLPAASSGTSSSVLSDNPASTLCDGGSIVLGTTPTTVPEGGDRSFQISLASPPICEVILVIASEDQTAITVEGSDAASISFPANDNAARTVTLNAVEDSNINSETITINLTDASGVLTPDSFSVSSVENDTGKFMFRSLRRFNGNLGGISGADAKCQADAVTYGHPGTYKALISDRNNRVACFNEYCNPANPGDHTDWVLTANTAYFRTDGSTQIGITNTNRIFHFDEGTLDDGLTDEDRIYRWNWTGLDGKWLTFGRHLGVPLDCNGWTNSDGFPNYGTFGNHTMRSSRIISDGSSICSDTKYLICVEQ